MTNWYRRNEAKWKYYQAHPDGPYMYSEWGPVPPSPGYRSSHARWLKQYKPLVEDGTWAWLEVWDSDLFAHPLPAGVVASVFANRETYLVLANYSAKEARVTTKDVFAVAGEWAGSPGNCWTFEPGAIRILRRCH